jgi:hypothetical protein
MSRALPVRCTRLLRLAGNSGNTQQAAEKHSYAPLAVSCFKFELLVLTWNSRPETRNTKSVRLASETFEQPMQMTYQTS